MVGRFTYSN